MNAAAEPGLRSLFLPKSLFWTLVYSKLVHFTVMLLAGVLATGFMQGAELFFEGSRSALASGLRGFVRWDAVHFVHIARDGYTSEQLFAFFPLLPLLMRHARIPFVDRSTSIALAGVAISNAAHLLASAMLYHLTKMQFKSERFAQLATLAFSWSAAAAFLTGIYSESLFALCSFTGLWLFYRRQWLPAALAWALGSGLRSNGVLMAGFFWFEAVQNWRLIAGATCCTVLVSAPLALYAAHAYYAVCPRFPDQPWCQSWVPGIYSHVQQTYWNVGLLRYYTLGNVPNFVLATPMLALCFACVYEYCRMDWARMLLFARRPPRLHGALKERFLIPHVYLLAFMLVYSLLFVHIQIVTRLFVFMPIVPWYIAHLVGHHRLHWPLCGLSAYGLVNCVLFGAFLPPA